MMYRKHNPSSGTHEIDVTPLIDVSLVLVVILLLTAPLAFESSIGVRSSRAQGRAAETMTEVSTVEITVVSDDEVRVNREVVARVELSTALRPLLGTSAGGRVLLDTRPGVTHGAFVFVLDEAKRCGAVDIAVVGG